MGTRAMISIDGKPFIATHWDGYPESLGADLQSLVNPMDKEKLIAVASKHTIDFADSSIAKELNAIRMKAIAERMKMPLTKVKAGWRRGNVQTADDSDITSIRNYDDWAEYQYDIDSKTGKITVRELAGSWRDKDLKKGKWKPLQKAVAEAEAEAKKRLKKVV